MIDIDDRNGVVLSYLVQIRERYVDTEWTNFTVAENEGTKTIDIGGLEKWRDYEYLVSGCTIGGCGKTNPIAIQRTDEDCKIFH